MRSIFDMRLKRYTDELESAEAVIFGMGATIDARDPTTNGHCQGLAHYATTLGRSLGLERDRLLVDAFVEVVRRGGDKEKEE